MTYYHFALLLTGLQLCAIVHKIMIKYRIVHLAAIYSLGFCTVLQVSQLHF